MQKKLIAAAVAGLVAVPAFAASVTVYGILDAGVERVSVTTPAGVSSTGAVAGSSASALRVTSGFNSGSRIGFKGVEELGNGLNVGFVLENGFRIDTGALKTPGTSLTTTDESRPKFFDRQALVYLSGGFGKVALGRQYGTQYADIVAPADATGYGHGGLSVPNMSARYDNAVTFETPDLNGLRGVVQYVAGAENVTTTSSKDQGQGFLMSLAYKQGPIVIGVGGTNVKGTDGLIKVQSNTVGGSYDFGIAKVFASYNTGKTSNSPLTTTTRGVSYDERMASIGAVVPAGPGRVVAQYSSNNDRLTSNQDGKKYSIGYLYDLSKRTNLYFGYVQAEGKNGRAAAVGYADATGADAAVASTVATTGTTKASSVAVGLRHSF